MSVKTKLKADEPVFMPKVVYQDPALYELVGLLGYDCVWICNEHIGIDPSKLDSLIRACRASGMDAVIRFHPANYQALLHPLEMGAKGVMLSQVKTVKQVTDVVDWMKFFPEGHRGVDAVNAEAAFGLIPFKDYLKRANDENYLIAQIETLDSIDLIEEIAAVKGVDVLFVGPGDLSVNFGIPGEFDHPKMQEVYRRVIEAAKANGIAAGLSCGFDKIPHFMEMGYRFFVGGSDYVTLKTRYTLLREDLEKMNFKLRPAFQP